MPQYNPWTSAANPALRGQGAVNLPLSSQAVMSPAQGWGASPGMAGPGSVASPAAPGTTPYGQGPSSWTGALQAPPGMDQSGGQGPGVGAFAPPSGYAPQAMGNALSGFGGPRNGFSMGSPFGGGGGGRR